VASTKAQIVAGTHGLNAVKVLLVHGASINRPGEGQCRGKILVDMVIKDEIEEQIPENIKDLIKEVAYGEGMAT
jgi:hypothetical protein